MEGDSVTVIATRGILENLRLPCTLYMDALALVKQEKFEQVVSLLEEILKKKPGSVKAQTTLMEVYSKLDGADEFFLKAKPIAKKRMLLLWLDMPRLNQISAAIQKDGSIEVVMGNSSGQKGYNITKEDLLWFIEVYPLAEKGYQAGQQKKYLQTIHYYKQALKLAPGCDLYLKSIGTCYAYLGVKEKALQYLQRAVKISPGNARIQANLQDFENLNNIVLISTGH